MAMRTGTTMAEGTGSYLRWSLRAILGALAGLLVSPATAVASAETIRFSSDILPLLSDHCFTCHGPDEASRKARLRLDTQDGSRARGKSGAVAVVPGRSADSEVVRRVFSADPAEQMPPPEAKRTLTPEQRDRLRRWVDEGAVWGRHWAFEPPRRPEIPVLPPEAGELRNPVDALVRARLRSQGMPFAPEASPQTLIRRVTLDLTGLPPTPEEVDHFVQDTAPEAYGRLVDRLLASPRLGERMAWEWLEAARYADSNGYQGDSERTMWPWRDWVVDAVNRNLPYDRFTEWQLAGDLLPDATLEQRLATGFLRNHMINGEGGRIPEENRIDYLFDQTETVGTVWLGATFNCTRCHDHKYDPYTQRDYFGMLAFFNQTPVDGSGGDPQARPNLEVPSPEQAGRRRDLEAKVAGLLAVVRQLEAVKFPRGEGMSWTNAPGARELPPDIRELLEKPPERRDAAQWEKLAAHWKERDPELQRRLEELREARGTRDAVARSIPRVMVMGDASTRRDTFLLKRGAYNQPGEPVSAMVPSGLAFRGDGVLPDRLGLARWLLQPDHPLTARVTVNRFWQMLFGVGLVKTAEDFGVQGERPLHPELLDWLATEWVDSGWDVKRLLRLLVTSATYRQASRVTPEAFELDPENRWLARGPRFRMPSWMIRDSALAAAGLLVNDRWGPPVKSYQPAGIWEEATFGNKRYEQDHGSALYRRSLYLFWRRIVGPTMFFDVASRQTCTVKTPRTNVPLHALLTLNEVTYVEAARALASRVLMGPNSGLELEQRIQAAVRRVLGRSPDPTELGVLSAALTRHRIAFAADPDAARRLIAVGESPADATLDPVDLAAWTVLCGTLLNLDEALTKE
jgi:mono/diheme cytochrome c family protein